MTVRIAGLSLKGFKNVRNGSFQMPEVLYGEECPSDLLAIFGRNGSGKSAAIEAFDILQRVMSGSCLPGRTHDLVNIDSDKAEIGLSLLCEDEGGRSAPVSYLLTIAGKHDAHIESERITYRGRTEEKAGGTGCSSFFTESGDALTDSLREYASTSMIVIQGEGRAGGRMMLPLHFLRYDGKHKVKGRMVLDLSKPFMAEGEEEDNLKEVISDINSVLGTIIPNMSINIIKASDGSLSLHSLKNGTPIPLRSESEGIIKLISLISVLVFVYNERGSALIIDELDASIYEYLLGEIMEVFRNGAAGQLIFTSHNLRVLEMIDRRSLIISTADPDDKYIRLPEDIPDTENLRNYYLRTVLLSNDKALSGETDPHDIARALRKAWRRHE